MMRGIAAAIVALLPALVSAKTAITHPDVWLMKRVGAPAISPDGKWVVFAVTDPAYEPKDVASDLWIAAADGSAKPRRLTFSKSAESGVVWSPDSRRIAFTAKREGDEAAQLYVLDIAGGGEALRVTSVWGGAAAAQWSPDGQSLLFSSPVYPGAKTDDENRKIDGERKARKSSARVYDGFPIRYWDHWLDDQKVHLFVVAAQAGAKARDLLAGTSLVAEAGFGGVNTDSGEELRGIWAPDGQSVVFACTTDRNRAAFADTHTQLYQAPVNGGEPKALTSGNDSYSRPQFAPDAKSLYAQVELATGKAYSLPRLARFSWPDFGPRTMLTGNSDRAVGAYGITADSAAIYFLSEDAGHDKVYRVAAAGGPVELAIDAPQGVYSGLAVAQRAPVMVANWESAVSPPEVVRLDAAAKTHAALTSFNADRAAQIDWQPVRHFWFTSKRGKKIHNLIALPPGFDESRKYPLFVVIHGGPASMWKDQFVIRWNYHLLASPGYVVLLTNYTGSTGFGEKFAQEIEGDPLAGPGEELNEAADEAIRRFGFIDGTRQAAGGASYGGHLANWLQATTTRYKCLVAHAGLINLESQWGTSDTIYHREQNNGGPVWEQGRVWREQNPVRKAASFQTPILVTVGEKDFRVPLNQSLENWSVLQRRQVPSRLVVFPEANHWVMRGEDSRFFYEQVWGWLKKWL